MKLDNAVIITKGICLTWIPTGTALHEGLSKISVTNILGVDKDLFSLCLGASIAGAGGLLAFLSTSFGNFMTNRNGNGNGVDNTVKPADPVKP